MEYCELQCEAVICFFCFFFAIWNTVSTFSAKSRYKLVKIRFVED